MEKKYQIFVSSTYKDLKEERKAIIESIINMNHIPAGMELFSASNDEQFEYIKKIIDNCDYYVLIIGGCYGSKDEKTGVSFTEKEFDYAISKNIPILVFMYENIEKLPTEKRDKNTNDIKRFLDKVTKGRLCKPWKNKDDLQSSVIISLNKQFSDTPQQGWSRGGQNNTELLGQINKQRIQNENLTNENKELKRQLEQFNVDIDGLASGQERFTCKYEYWDSFYKYNKSDNTELTWDEIFSLIGPYLQAPISYSGFKGKLEEAIKQKVAENLSYINIEEDDVQTIKIQLMTNNLIVVYSANTTKGGLAEFIQITPKGLKYLQKIKTVKTKIEA